jgi:hypothetical protein
MKIYFSHLLAMASMLLGLLSANLHGTWEPSQTISNPAFPQVVDLYGGVLIVNPQGNAISVWVDNSNPVFPTPGLLQETISSAFYLRNFGWQAPQNVSSLALNQFGKPLFGPNADPDVGMNSSNYAVAVWESSFNDVNFPNVVVAATRDPQTGLWGPTTILSDQSGNFFPQNINVSLNEAGTALASWRTTDENSADPDQFVQASFLPLGGTWTTPVNFARFFFNPGDGKATPYINENGNAVVIWQGRDADRNFNIQVVTYKAATNTWSPVTTLDTDTISLFISEDPRAKMDPSGKAVAVWQNEGAVNTSFFNGTFWEPIITIGTCLVQDGFDGPDIAVDLQGNFTVTWTDLDGNIVAAARLPNGSWSAPQVISIPGTFNFFDPFQSNKTLAVNPAGDLMQVWFSEDTIIQSAFKPFGQPWQAPQVVDASGDYDELRISLSVGLANCGFAIADWETFGNTLVKAAINENLLLPANAQVSTCCEKFATQTVCVNFFTVTPDPCAASFNIYCNGVLFANIPNTNTNPLTLTLPICNKLQCIFTITAVNAFGVEGDPVPVRVVPCPCKKR